MYMISTAKLENNFVKIMKFSKPPGLWKLTFFENILVKIIKFSKPSGLWRAHKEPLASKQPVSSAESQKIIFVRIFGENENLSFLICSISTIEDDAFDDLHSLQWLKLWNNNLQTLHYELMEPVLDTLIHLDIHSEPLFHLTIFY